jgi:cyclopropane-fatty-acyl-phospholipid synthase
MFQRLLDSAMEGFVVRGRLTIHHAEGAIVRFGPGNGPEAAFRIRDAAATRRLVLNPALAIGELYMDGGLEPVGCGIGDLVELLVLNHWQGGSHPMDRLLGLVRQVRRRLDQLNPAPRARRNVAHHYDLDRRLFSLFLDRDMQYSCAYYPRGDETLEEAQAAKKRHIAAKLRLDRPDLEVLEIGCGWGGMALTLARDCGARVTGITLSQEQLDVARQRAAEAGLAHRCRFALMDYRAWDRKVDRVLSVAMFEAVGLLHFRRYFAAIRDAMKPDGVAVVHAIGRAWGPANTNPWLAKYIFPGGYSPALSEVMPAVEKTGLWITDVEILRLHYALTIAEWRRRFAASRDAIQSLYDERFCRMFEFYLAGCEYTFRHGDHMNWQLQLTRDRAVLPLTRDWIAEAEARAARGTMLPAIHSHPQAEGGAATRASV